jgi:hypothetical protein
MSADSRTIEPAANTIGGESNLVIMAVAIPSKDVAKLGGKGELSVGEAGAKDSFFTLELFRWLDL